MMTVILQARMSVFVCVSHCVCVCGGGGGGGIFSRIYKRSKEGSFS